MNAYMTLSDDPFFSKFCSWTVGHEQLFRDMLRMKNHQAGSSIYNAYPPHNLVENSDGKYTIELATAGFTKEELEVKTEYSKLTISGRKAEEEDDEKIVHKGIAKRPFSKSFTLAEDVVVDDVSFKDGLLTIKLQKVVPEDKKEKIYSL
jgi:molecular chaperone IbpA|tara:strand:+ start:419 stop:865 length:447 start_codon:yes stop_codon:yes gene_type:complete